MDLRQWLDEMDKLGELEHIEGASVKGEIGALSSLNYRQPNPTALLFDNIEGYPGGMRVLSASLSNARRMGLTLNLGDGYDDRKLMEVLPEKTRQWTETAKDFPALEVETAPFLENR